MKLKEIYNSNKPVISYEVFPPKGELKDIEAKTLNLLDELKILAEYNPAYISVTYGAGGSTQETSLDLVLKIKKHLNITPVPHFTCVGTVKNKIHEYLDTIQKAGIKNILALRGDPPKGETKFIKPENGFGYANELVEYIKGSTDLSIAVAGYPEGHLECESLSLDLENLKRKVDAGADTIVTQLFFDNKIYFDFVIKAKEAGINIPIIPGILPITSLSQLEKVTSLCKCTIPESLISKLQANKENLEVVKQIGLEFAINQCKELIENGAPGLHFYTLNKAFATKTILDNLKLS